MGYDLKYCSIHYNTPYGMINEVVPIFKEENYKIKNSKGENLCEYVGCNECNNLLSLYSGYWCNSHGRIITSLRLGSLGKSSKDAVLLNKMKEFSYRKIYNKELFVDIEILEKELQIDPKCCSNLNINIIHYEYVCKNLLKKTNIFNEIIDNRENYFTYFKKTNREYFDDLFKIKTYKI